MNSEARTFAWVNLALAAILSASVVVSIAREQAVDLDLSFLLWAGLAVGILQGRERALAGGRLAAVAGSVTAIILLILRIVGVLDLDEVRFGAVSVGEPTSLVAILAGIVLCAWGVVVLRPERG